MKKRTAPKDRRKKIERRLKSIKVKKVGDP